MESHHRPPEEPIISDNHDRNERLRRRLMRSHPDFVIIEWIDHEERSETPCIDQFLIGRLDEIIDEAVLANVELRSVECPEHHTREVLERLAERVDVHPDRSVEVNGHIHWLVPCIDGGNAFVPDEGFPGMETLAIGTSVWEPLGGRLMGTQEERIVRLGDLYWVVTHGNIVNRQLVIGRFHDEADAVRIAVECAVYFSFDVDGTIICELDRWPQDQPDPETLEWSPTWCLMLDPTWRDPDTDD